MQQGIREISGLGDRRLEEWLGELVRAGVDALQVREKDLPDRELLSLARRARETLPPRVRVLVNGRLDVALAAGADGVHLPVSGLPADRLRRWAHRAGAVREVLIGRSCHSPEEVEAAAREGADYATFGPVFPTPSKAPYGEPPGLDGLRRAARAGLPLLALGGIDAAGARRALEAGAAGVAGIRAFQDPSALAEMTVALTERR